MKFSVIIPVYNRPDEIDELLHSLTMQQFTDFEVIVAEDGSTVPCKDIVDKYTGSLDIKYFYKPNTGRGDTRNYGAERSKGDYLIIVDSDCIIPEGYFTAIEKELEEEPSDAFGGRDHAHESFTVIQKAINYSMTSFFTTGGIRGGKKKMDKFHPRSCNLGIRRELYYALGGFSEMPHGEDIDFSIRVFNAGYSCRLFPDAWVYHKRRTDFRKFFKQVYHFGEGRIALYKMYPQTLKLVYLLPSIFTVGVILLLLGSIFYPCLLLLLLLYSLFILTDATIRNRSLLIGAYAVVASFIQLLGYGLGFLRAWWNECVMRR